LKLLLVADCNWKKKGLVVTIFQYKLFQLRFLRAEGNFVNGLQIFDGRAFQYPASAGLIRRTELSETTKLSA